MQLEDFYFANASGVSFRLNGKRHPMFEVNTTPNVGEFIKIGGNEYVVTKITHEFDGDSKNISHSIVLDIEAVEQDK